jgi:hypothetical protein
VLRSEGRRVRSRRCRALQAGKMEVRLQLMLELVVRLYVVVKEELRAGLAQACLRDPTRGSGLRGLRGDRVLVRVYVMVKVGLRAPEAAEF